MTKGEEAFNQVANATAAKQAASPIAVWKPTPKPLPYPFGPTHGKGPVPRPFNRWGEESTGHFDSEHYQTAWQFQKGWIDRGRWTGIGIPVATFTCYLAKYADGDWNCNPTALENMLTQVQRWSKGRIEASVQPKALDLGSGEIFKIKPPFIFFTGHRNFHLTDREVENLREYLLSGGTVWADNSLPGRHSRFDEAFRREMGRVLPDRSFEVVPMDHPIFQAHFHFREMPRGMNSYAEPIEQIRFGDETIVIYTQNAYSDLWETALDEQGKVDSDLYLNEDTGQSYYKWGPHWGSYLTGFLYRNVNEASIVDANELGLNIIVHLLTQYEEKFRRLGKL